MKKNLYTTICGDKNGNIVLTQAPNFPIVLWLLAKICAAMWDKLFGGPSPVLLFAADAALFMWALLEITQGASLFRRGLGVVALVFLLRSKL